jgi:hypothetical protein
MVPLGCANSILLKKEEWQFVDLEIGKLKSLSNKRRLWG